MNPGDTLEFRGRHHRDPPLNEGRDVNPGDTTCASAGSTSTTSAQRRPGRESRRHGLRLDTTFVRNVAQRRPGRESRRHVLKGATTGTLPARSTKAGT